MIRKATGFFQKPSFWNCSIPFLPKLLKLRLNVLCVCVKQGPHVEEVVSSYMYRQAMEGNTWNTFMFYLIRLPEICPAFWGSFLAARLSKCKWPWFPISSHRWPTRLPGWVPSLEDKGTKNLMAAIPPLKGQRICLEDSDRPETWIKYDKIGFLNCDILEFQWFLKRPGGSGGPQSLGLIHPTWRSSSTAARCAKFVTVWGLSTASGAISQDAHGLALKVGPHWDHPVHFMGSSWYEAVTRPIKIKNGTWLLKG